MWTTGASVTLMALILASFSVMLALGLDECSLAPHLLLNNN
jgi:hypothetical protein